MWKSSSRSKNTLVVAAAPLHPLSFVNLNPETGTDKVETFATNRHQLTLILVDIHSRLGALSRSDVSRGSRLSVLGSPPSKTEPLMISRSSSRRAGW
ncbi:hypothetical protein D9619_012908 [Psilocybe cf. subviscida]|uniref:Uncharacterized protein n=1 Tax=Psilocybe cf. subviscida TaxID=2480587 RepID=A0A8H5F4W7_9AGAR|nr:hypothetical protein D9619_012908 [Psilocybe cf. subviscida]